MSATIATNKQAGFAYHLHDSFEAGLALEGWEVKSLRAGKCQLRDAYVLPRNSELWLFNALITPLATTSRQSDANPSRLRKLLLNRREIDSIQGAIGKKGMTCVVEKLYWKNNLIKCGLRLATGKKLHDKRATIRDREWSIQQQRLHKLSNR